MSYSFNVRAPNKAAAKLAVAAQLEIVAANQKCHARDRVQAQAAADTFIELLNDDESRDVAVSMSGWLTGTWEGSDVTSVTGANVSVSANLTTREQAA